jgi:hypothetical protein
MSKEEKRYYYSSRKGPWICGKKNILVLQHHIPVAHAAAMMGQSEDEILSACERLGIKLTSKNVATHFLD